MTNQFLLDDLKLDSGKNNVSSCQRLGKNSHILEKQILALPKNDRYSAIFENIKQYFKCESVDNLEGDSRNVYYIEPGRYASDTCKLIKARYSQNYLKRFGKPSYGIPSKEENLGLIAKDFNIVMQAYNFGIDVRALYVYDGAIVFSLDMETSGTNVDDDISWLISVFVRSHIKDEYKQEMQFIVRTNYSTGCVAERYITDLITLPSREFIKKVHNPLLFLRA